MQPNQIPSIVPIGINNATPNAPSNNTTTARRSGHQVSTIDFSGSNGVQGISNKDFIHSPFLDSVNKILPQVQDNNSVPALINLETTGLRWSPQLAALQNNNDAPAIVAYTSSTTPSLSRLFSKSRPRLSFLLVYNLVGSLWTFATTSSHANHETYSFVAQLSNNFDRLNGLFDDTINNI